MTNCWTWLWVAILAQSAGCSHTGEDLERALPHLHEVTGTSDSPSVGTAYVVQVTDDGRRARYASVFIEVGSRGAVVRGRVAGAWSEAPKANDAEALVTELDALFEQFPLGDSALDHPLPPPMCTIVRASGGTATWIVRREYEVPEVCLEAVSLLGWRPSS